MAFDEKIGFAQRLMQNWEASDSGLESAQAFAADFRKLVDRYVPYEQNARRIYFELIKELTGEFSYCECGRIIDELDKRIATGS